MLQLSEAAASHLDEARSQQGLPETCGVRFSAKSTDDGRASLEIAFVETPGPDDETAVQHGLNTFVAPEVSEPLAAAELDVGTDPTNERQLVLKPQHDA